MSAIATQDKIIGEHKNTSSWRRTLLTIAALGILLCFPAMASAVIDNDLDGIDDSLERIGGPGVTFEGVTYPACAAGTTIINRYTCVSDTSKDIFVYILPICTNCTPPAGGGFLAANGMITMSPLPVNATQCTTTTSTSCTGLFGYMAASNVPTTTGKVDGLGIGIHVAVVNTPPASRTVGLLGQQAVLMTVDEAVSSPGSIFGRTDQGTPTRTGNSTIWPVYLKNYLRTYVTGGSDVATVWKPYLQRTGSHELSHASALTALYNASLGQYHYATGAGTVMDDKVQCDSKKKTCMVYNEYSTGDIPCLLSLGPSTDQLQCIPLP